MVHPDLDVATIEQQLACQLIEFSLITRLRNIIVMVAALRWLDPRHERETVEGNPVRSQLKCVLCGHDDALRRLLRQTIDQIEVDRIIAQRTRLIRHPCRLLEGLKSVDDPLHLRIKILHTK